MYGYAPSAPHGPIRSICLVITLFKVYKVPSPGIVHIPHRKRQMPQIRYRSRTRIHEVRKEALLRIKCIITKLYDRQALSQ